MSAMNITDVMDAAVGACDRSSRVDLNFRSCIVQTKTPSAPQVTTRSPLIDAGLRRRCGGIAHSSKTTSETCTDASKRPAGSQRIIMLPSSCSS